MDSKPEKVKLVFLGDPSVGKTSMLNQLMFDKFDPKIEVTFELTAAHYWHGFCHEEDLQG